MDVPRGKRPAEYGRESPWRIVQVWAAIQVDAETGRELRRLGVYETEQEATQALTACVDEDEETSRQKAAAEKRRRLTGARMQRAMGGRQ